MLKVSFNLAAVAAMIFGIVGLGHLIEVDSLNSPTIKPIPDGQHQFGMKGDIFKWHGRKIATNGTIPHNLSANKGFM
jgi:hypothetical protein